ncbi:MAG: hypothetical protein JOY84_03135 [Curvibacter sp.]|nr:hypothetical protein [Curvibacter sp.]
MTVRLQIGSEMRDSAEEHRYFIEIFESSPQPYYLHAWHAGGEAQASCSGMTLMPLADAVGQPFYAEAAAMQTHWQRTRRATEGEAQAGD